MTSTLQFLEFTVTRTQTKREFKIVKKENYVKSKDNMTPTHIYLKFDIKKIPLNDKYYHIK